MLQVQILLEAQMEYMICEKCGERISSETEVVYTAYPDIYCHGREIRESLEKLFDSFESTRPKPECKNYHTAEYYVGRQGGERSSYLCGPLRPETQEEYYVHIAGSNMRR